MELLKTDSFTLSIDDDVVSLDGKKLDSSYRKLSAMKEVIMDKNAITAENGDEQIYMMYRDVAAESDRSAFDKIGVRYDVTIMPDYRLGNELNKTLGHYHPKAEDGVSYPEIYEILKGEALILLQKILADGGVDLRLAHAKAGQKVLIMPDYGHITINSGHSLLAMSNLVCTRFTSDYKSIEAMHGGAIYVLSDGSHVANNAYKNVSITDPYVQPNIGSLMKDINLYDAFVSSPADFEFLSKPSILEGLINP